MRLVGSTNRIKRLKTAKRFVQNHARKCYSEKNWDELLDEAFLPGLTKALITKGHHSPSRWQVSGHPAQSSCQRGCRRTTRNYRETGKGNQCNSVFRCPFRRMAERGGATACNRRRAAHRAANRCRVRCTVEFCRSRATLFARLGSKLACVAAPFPRSRRARPCDS